MRRAGRTLAWVLALAAAGATGARWVDLAWSPWVLVQALVPFAAPVALLCLGGVPLTRSSAGRAGLAGLCLLVLAVHAAIWVPWWTADPPRAGTGLTVMTVNLYRGRADPAAVTRAVRAHDVDLLVLTEMRASAAAGLRRQGLPRLLPYTVGDAPVERGSTVIRSRLPLRVPVAHGGTGGTGSGGAAAPPSKSPVALVHAGEDVVVRAVHPPPPVPARADAWRAVLRGLAGWARRTQGTPMVVAGDFNASVDHPGLRDLLAAGLRDAHEAAGAGRPTTWPRGRAYPAFVHIDHVLVRGLDVASVEELHLPGTDHDAIVARLVVPARP